MGVTIPKNLASGGANITPDQKLSLFEIVKSIVADLDALKATQDAVIDSATQTAQNAVPKTVIGTKFESS